MKIIPTIILLFLFFTSFSQNILFQIEKDRDDHTQIDDNVTFTSLPISNLLNGKQVQKAFPGIEKYKSKYAERLSRVYTFEYEESRDAVLINDLRSLNDVAYVEFLETPQLAGNPCPSNDPTDAPWNLSRHEITCVQEAHCISQGDPGIVIAIIDNGFLSSHPEYDGKVVYSSPGAYNGQCHGTQTSITAAGATDNGFGISSSGYNCNLMQYLWGGYATKILDATERGARIINNSWIHGYSQTEQNMTNLVADMGTIVVGSAGNGAGQGGHSLNYPASYDNVISVSSVSSGLCMETTYNFWGDPYDPPLYHTQNSAVDVVAQGFAVVTGDCNGGGQSIAYGTSIAGPHVAGIIGLMLTENPCLNHDDVLDILISTGQDVSGVCNNTATYYPNGNVPPVPCAEEAVIVAQGYVAPDLIISQNTEWDQKYVSGNVRVKAGATLSIFGQASFGPSSKLIVERDADLIVDGGILTSCKDQWKGIVVEGDASSGNQDLAGRVSLINEAVIENAKNAISMQPLHIPWPQTPNYWGGLVEADNATFRKCKRAVEFMRFGTGFIKDASFFNNCTFENIETEAVTIWADNGVTFTGCTFDEIATSSIYAYDTEVIVNDGCVFSNQPIGVNVFTTYPIPFGPRIGLQGTQPNDFTCDAYGVYAMSQGNIKPMIAENNNFLGGDYGIHIDGISNYEIRYNDFLDHYASIETVSTGSFHPVWATYNNISSSTYGAHGFFNNAGLEYLDNCFDFNSLADIQIVEGSIFVTQGNEDVAAGNCFSQGGVPEIDNTFNPEIQYWVWEDEPETSCEFPNNVANNPSFMVKVEKLSTTKNDDDCGSEFSPGVINVSTFCRGPFKNKNKILEAISDLEDLIISVQNNPKLSQAYKNYLLAKYNRCLKYLKSLCVLVEVDIPLDSLTVPPKDQIDIAISILDDQDEFQFKTQAYGLMVNTDQLIRANSYLNNLNVQTQEEIDFVWAQNINLDYLTDIDTYVLSPVDENKLYQLGQNVKPLYGYARGIYEILKGERIYLDIPDPRNSTRPREKSSSMEAIKFSSYPNPVGSHEFTVSFDRSDQLSEIGVYDAFGKQQYLSNELNGKRHVIPTQNFKPGIYLVFVKDFEGNIMYQEKMIKL